MMMMMMMILMMMMNTKAANVMTHCQTAVRCSIFYHLHDDDDDDDDDDGGDDDEYQSCQRNDPLLDCTPLFYILS